MISGSAPGKLVVLGEYAVLEGAPALVFAVNRRAIANLVPATGSSCHVTMGRNAVYPAAFDISNGKFSWRDAVAGKRYELLRVVWQHLYADDAVAASATTGFQLNLDTDAFSEGLSGDPSKYGLGSSAALVTALACVLAARTPSQRDNREWLNRIHAVHREFQGGRGSGLDVAASLLGGAISFSSVAGRPDAKRLGTWRELPFGAVWTGKSASTAAMLKGLEAWKRQQEGQYFEHMATMRDTAEAAEAAFQQRDLPKFLRIFETYGNHLRNLGEYSGLDIFSREHEAISRCANSCGVHYKTCGAGGGDIGIALATDNTKMSDFRNKVIEQGFKYLDLAIDEQGTILTHGEQAT